MEFRRIFAAPLLLFTLLAFSACFYTKQKLPEGARPAPESDGWASNAALRYDFSLTNIRADVSGQTVTVSWQSEFPSDTMLEWGMQDIADNRKTVNEQTTQHSVTLTNVAEGRYRFRVTSATRNYLTASVDNLGSFFFDVRIYPAVSNVNATTDQALRTLTVTWTTDRDAKGFLELGSDTTFAGIVGDEGTTPSQTTHSITVTLPAYDTAYMYRLRSVDDEGDQTVTDNGGVGFAVTIASPVPPPPPDGTSALPYIIDTSTISMAPVNYSHSANTAASTQSLIDRYYPATQKEDGNEVVYKFTITKDVTFKAELTSGGVATATVDNDVHLLTDLSTVLNKPGVDFNTFKTATLYNSTTTSRNDVKIGAPPPPLTLTPGTYYVVVDGFKNASGTIKNGPFTLNVQMTETHTASTIAISVPPWSYSDTRDTSTGESSINYYPGYTQNESGPEIVYSFTVPASKKYKVAAALSGMGVGVDIDIHLLSSLNPLTILARNDTAVTQTLEAGTYYLVADSYVNSAGVVKKGTYTLTVNFTDVTNVVPPSSVVQGYLTYWSTSTAEIQWNRLTHLLYFCMEPNANGTIKSLHGWNTTPSVTVAKNNNVKVLLSVCLFGASDIATMVNSPANRTTMINNIIAQVTSRGAHGVDLDFEIPPKSAKAGLTTFVHELRLAFSAEGNAPDGQPYRIHMALMPIDWAGAYDIANFIDDLDYAMVMSYEGHSGSSTQAGPTNKLFSPVPPWAQNFSYQYFFNHWLGKMGQANAAKLLGGVGYYMQDYATQSFLIPSNSLGSSYVKTKMYYQILPLVKSLTPDGVNTVLGYESTIENPYYFYKASGVSRQVWYDTKASLKKKYAYMQSREMGGMGIWALNYDKGLTDTWDAIAESWW